MKRVIFMLCLSIIASGIWAQTLIFSDNFSTADLSNYIITKTSDDTSYQSGFDVSTVGIPNSPNGDNLALRTACNIVAPTGEEAINLYYNNPINLDRFLVEVDIYLRWPVGGSGTTEHAGVGIFGSGTKVNTPRARGALPTDTDGLTFGYNSDGDEALSDLYLNEGSPSGQTQVGTWANPNRPDPTGQFYTDQPYASIASPLAAFGNQWKNVKINYEEGLVIVKVDNVEVVRYNTTLGSGVNKLVYLVHSDLFASVATPSEQSFCLFDNLKIYELPTPTPVPTPVPTPTPLAANTHWSLYK